MVATTLKETPLVEAHKKAGARMVDFAGWYMPVQYKSIITEHTAVRNKVGVFDVSHMGEFIVSGSDAHAFIQYVIANDLNKLTSPNCAIYSQLVRPNGGTVDDLIVYRRDNDFLVVVNASNIEKDWHWMQSHLSKFPGTQMKNISDATALLALQGPNAVTFMKDLVGEWVEQMGSFTYGTGAIDGAKVSFGRTGYTGEDGFEIFIDADKVEQVWNALLTRGTKYGIEPCGLGARDTLRLEAGLPLYGHELDDETSPLEAGLGWSVKLDKGGDFLGRDAMLAQKQNGLPKQLVCLTAEGKALPRQGYAVQADDKKIGAVTSGSQGIHVGYPIAFAFVPPNYAKVGQAVSVEIRDSKVPAAVVKRPWYKRSK
jgi:aminomethyltransferase